MRCFTLITCLFNISIFKQISSSQVSKDGKVFYVSEPSLKFDHVTSKEECISRSGSLLHVLTGSYTNRGQLQDLTILNLTENSSYWLDGSSSYMANVCLLLFNASTVMATGCKQKHGFICEIGLGFTHTISATDLSTITPSLTQTTSTAVESKLHLDAATIKPSFSGYITSRTSMPFFSLNSATNSLQKAPLFPSAQQLSSSLVPTDTNISPTEVKTESSYIIRESMSTMGTESQHGPPHHMFHSSTSGNQTRTPQNCTVYCYRYLSSLAVVELIEVLRNNSVPDTINNSKLEESPLVSVKDTGRAKRKLTSAPDSRYSSRAIGGVAVIIITFVPVCFIVMDLPKFLKHLKFSKLM